MSNYVQTIVVRKQKLGVSQVSRDRRTEQTSTQGRDAIRQRDGQNNESLDLPKFLMAFLCQVWVFVCLFFNNPHDLRKLV